MLSDVVEAVIGALFISEGFSTQSVEILFDRLFKPFYTQHISLHTLKPHPNTTLFELLQAEGCHEHRLAKETAGGQTRYDGEYAMIRPRPDDFTVSLSSAGS